MARQLSVLVVGASIAGPCSAYFLAKAGAKVTVIERWPQFRPGGQNIDIRLTGVQVMRKIPGMIESVTKSLAPIDGLQFVRADGSSYGLLGRSGDADKQSLLSEYEIFRDDLSRILMDLTKDNDQVSYIFGEQVTALQQSENGITVDFMHRAREEYDLVVACDGTSSRTRAIALECNPRDHFHSVNAWVAYSSTKKDLLGHKIGTAHSRPGGRTVTLGAESAKNNRAAFFRSYPSSDTTSIEAFRQANKTPEGLRDLIVKDYSDMGWRIPEILSTLQTSNDLYAGEVGYVKVPQITRGRFTMVGDAGYGPGLNGTGTTLAFTGAYVLAGELAKHNGDVLAGLAGYEKTMEPIIKEYQKSPPGGLSFMCPQSSLGLWLRNHIFQFITWSGIANFAQSFFGAAMADSDKFRLEEYPWVK